MGDAESSKVFVTKLSLPKFVSMIKRLTPSQRNLVCSMGFQHLLHLCCDFLPRGLIIYLVSNFVSKTRTLKLPDRSFYTVTPLCVNKVLGTPIGGKKIGEKADPQLRISIASLTKCQGHYPTINELDKLITPELEGDAFKIVFGMYAITAFLCPSSHDAVSPFYLHIFKDPNEISSYDFSSAILDKLVSCIDAYNEGITSVLGGNLLLLMAIYFEFLDSDVIPAPSKSLLPRLSVWSSALVREIEMMDCVCKNSFQYGRLPIKDVTHTLFGFTCKQGDARAWKSYDQLLNFVLSICPEDHHAVVKHQLPLIMGNMFDEIMDSFEQVVMKNIMNILGIIPTIQSLPHSNNRIISETQISQFKSPATMGTDEVGSNSHSKSILPAPVCNMLPSSVSSNPTATVVLIDGDQTGVIPYVSSSVPATDDKDKDVVLGSEVDGSNGNVSSVLYEPCSNISPGSLTSKPAGSLPLIEGDIITDSTYVRSFVAATDDKVNDLADHLFLLPVPSDEILEKLDQEACKNSAIPDIQELIGKLKYIHLSSEFDLPLCTELSESMYPQKIDCEVVQDCVPSNQDIVSYFLQEALAESKQRRIIEDNDCLAFGKVNFSDILDGVSSFTNVLATSSAMPIFNRNKRTSNMVKSDIAEQCVALKKRAKMFQYNEDFFAESENALSIAATPLLGLQDQCEALRGSHHDGNTFAPATTHLISSNGKGETSSGPNNNCPMKTPDRSANLDRSWDDAEFDRELLLSTLRVEAEKDAYRSNSQFINQENTSIHFSERSPSNVIRSNSQLLTHENSDIHISEITNSNVITSFTSTLAEKDVFDDIIARIPKNKKAKTKNVVRMGSTWAEHRVFALSMMVYGNVNPYVMNMLGKAVMVEDAEKEKLGLLPSGHWKRFYFSFNVAALFMKSCENPGTLSKYLGHEMIGIKLDSRDLVHLPLFTSGFYFLLVVNFRAKVFEVLYPNNKDNLLSNHANVAINNFKLAFKIAYKHSIVRVDNMQTVFRSVCSSEKDSDSGVYVMELIRHQTNGKILCFQPNHAKPLRENLTFYMLTHPFNEVMPPETKVILTKHNIPFDYKSTPGYYPWMHEQGESSSEASRDSIEALVLF